MGRPNQSDPPQAGGSPAEMNANPNEGGASMMDPDGMNDFGDGLDMNGNNGAARMETCEGRDIPALNENAGAAGAFVLTGALETSDDFAGPVPGQ